MQRFQAIDKHRQRVGRILDAHLFSERNALDVRRILLDIGYEVKLIEYKLNTRTLGRRAFTGGCYAV